LAQRNKELENMHASSPRFDSSTVTHQHLLSEIFQHPLDREVVNMRETSSTIIPTTSLSTPVPPPKSPYRSNYDSKHKIPAFPMPKRPPVLKLTKSNYTSLHSNMLDIHKENLDSSVLISPHYPQNDDNPSNPSSPTSTTSSSSAGMNTPLLDLDGQLSTSPHKEHNAYTMDQKVLKHFSLSKTQHNNKHSQREPVRHSTQNTKSKSEPSTPVRPRNPRYDSLMTNNTVPSVDSIRQLSDINVNMISYSIKTCHRGREASVFTIGVCKKNDSTEMWKIEKSLSDLVNLDSRLKESNPAIISNLKRLPEKSSFSSHSPAKVDERKAMIEEYLQQALVLRSANTESVLKEFLSSDRIQYLPITLTNDLRIKQGYLTKKGKNFGGWKARYFVLDNTGSLKYYESKHGAFIGTISLFDSQVASQIQPDSGNNNPYRHAFVILEPKSNSNSPNKHIFCADSDKDRDSWVEALRPYTNQAHIAQDVLSRCFTDDGALDQFFVQPSSSTESTKSNSLTYFSSSKISNDRRVSLNSPTSPRASSASTTDSSICKNQSSESSNTLADESNEEKKLKQKANRKSFWSKKMFGGAQANDTLPPISPQGMVYDYNYVQAMNDYEETRGDKQVFGIPLEDAITVSRVSDGYYLPTVVHRCIEYLEAKGGLTEEGIYRLSGSSAKVKILKKRFNDAGDIKLLDDTDEYHDVHAIAGLLKMWLRELPENVLTEAALPNFLRSTHIDDQQEKLREIRRLISLLPLPNYTLLRSLCAHLIRVIENFNTNKMTLRNISIVFSATLGIPSVIFNTLLVEFDYIFWTNRCTKEDQEATSDLEDTIDAYMQIPSEEEEEEEKVKEPATIINPLVQRFAKRHLRRNSVHYQDNTPKEFISLEKQLEVVWNESSCDDEEANDLEGEPAVAYYASRFDANSKQR
ncbi:hypothetical protein CU098_012393, partial [Rhizopus stolonifer]